jgi:dCTP deaminase
VSVLSSGAVRAAIREPDLERRLVITPLLDPDRQLQDASVDLRLGTEFLVPTRTDVSLLEPHKEGHAAEVKKVFRSFHVGMGATFVLHPKQFVLGSTLEYVRFPDDLMGYVEGRSSWGRNGLQIATATVVSPGFAGVLTFEISNVGEVPVRLRTGTRIAQMVIHRLDGAEDPYAVKPRAQFRIPTRPEVATFETDPDRDLLDDYERAGA